jgi:hypothetical protein
MAQGKLGVVAKDLDDAALKRQLQRCGARGGTRSSTGVRML